MATFAEAIVTADLSASGKSVVEDPSRKTYQLAGTGVLPRQPRDQAYQASNVHAEILIPEHVPNPRPSELLFGGLQDPDLQVVRPIPLDVCVESDGVVVSWREIDEFGSGATLSCALDDFAHTLRELYRHLNADDVKPGADLRRVRAVLHEYIVPRTK